MEVKEAVKILGRDKPMGYDEIQDLLFDQQKAIERLKIEKELLSGGLSRSVITTKEVDAENTKLKEENKALLGVIEGMKLIINNLEKKEGLIK